MNKEISPRHQIAEDIAKYIRENNLASPYGGTAYLATLNNKKYYAIGFSYPRAIDGEIAVYSPKFIQVTYQFGVRKGNPVFESKTTALKFIKEAFIEVNWEKANKVPHKPTTNGNM